jgi:hypothetical protein
MATNSTPVLTIRGTVWQHGSLMRVRQELSVFGVTAGCARPAANNLHLGTTQLMINQLLDDLVLINS